MHGREITAITNPTVNSYKRLIPGFEAPVYVRGRGTTAPRSCASRYEIGQGGIDPHRVPGPDPAVQPIPVFSVMLAAGLKGIEQGYELPTEASSNVFG